ncbi:unnamed protein product, partial [Owenia fusiformis]
MHIICEFLIIDLWYYSCLTLLNIMLMVEKTNSGVGHCNLVIITCINNCLIIGRSSWRSDKLNATLLGPINVVTEWEEGIGAQRNAFQLGQPFRSLSLCKFGRRVFKHAFPGGSIHI